MRNKNLTRRICAGFFGLYGLVMIWLLFLQRDPADTMSYNIVPFRTIFKQFGDLIHGEDLWHTVVNLVGNVIMFIPLGLLPAIWSKQRKLSVYLLTVAASIVVVELIQLFTTLGMADVDDLLFNILGAWIGFELWRTIDKIFRLNW